jgi:hypothetical protein
VNVFIVENSAQTRQELVELVTALPGFKVVSQAAYYTEIRRIPDFQCLFNGQRRRCVLRPRQNQDDGSRGNLSARPDKVWSAEKSSYVYDSIEIKRR